MRVILKKKICIALLFVCILICSISAIHASDVNITDDSAICSNDNANFQMEDESPLSNSDEGSSDIALDENVKNQTEITSPTTSVYYKGSFKVTLKDSNSSLPLANKTLNFIINNAEYTSVTDNNGVASVSLTLNPGKYNAMVYFDGDSEYGSSGNLTVTIEVLSTIKAANIVKYYKASTPFTARFFYSNGNALANRYVSIAVNGKSYTKKTDGNGYASLNVNLNPGTYKIVSTDPVTGYRLTTTFSILSTIVSSDVKKVEGEKFWARFLKSNGKPLANQNVKLKFKGKILNLKTNSNGLVSLSLAKLKKGTYNVVCYNKDGLSKSYKVTVYPRKAATQLSSSSYTFYMNETKELKVKLSTSLADNSNSGKVVKIKINGKTYSRKTDGDGIATLRLPSLNKGIYTAEFIFEGNYFFKPSKATRTVNVYDTSNTRMTVKGTTSFGYGAGTSLKLAYTVGGVPLAKKDVTLTIGDTNFIRTTDNNGIVSLPIHLNLGDYTVNYHTDNGYKIKGTSGSFDINVFKRSDSKLTWKSGVSYKDNLQIFTVLLTDLNGKPVSGQTVELTVDGETYMAKTASNGYAKFRTDVAIGKYIVSLKFNGCNDYLSTSASKSINVILSKYGKGLNEKSVSYLSAYLRSSSHCKVGSAGIKFIVNKLTKGLTNPIDKAKAILNFVRDDVEYSFYYNSYRGSGATLRDKKGNCVDQAHLLVAMYRTAGFKARYVHGTCLFNSGHVYGHVWTQVAIGNTWYCADPTGENNALGKITNWKTNSYSIHAKYSSLPF